MLYRHFIRLIKFELHRLVLYYKYFMKLILCIKEIQHTLQHYKLRCKVETTVIENIVSLFKKLKLSFIFVSVI